MTMILSKNLSEADFAAWQLDRENLWQEIAELREARDFLRACCKGIIADCEKATAELTKENKTMREALERIGRMDAQAIALIALGQIND
jgi:hypothetical protein